jgi:hypothetical protein
LIDFDEFHRHTSAVHPLRRPTPLAALIACALAIAGAHGARADKLLFSGTHALKFSHNGVIKEVSASGTGVAIANGSSGPLDTVQLTRPFAKITETVTATTPGIGIDEIRFEGVRINPTLPGPNGLPGVFAPVLVAANGMTLTKNTLPAGGTIRLCNLSGCPGSVPVKLTQTNMGVAIGPGAGGTFIATGMSGTMVTVMGAPWTVNTTTVSYRTKSGGVGTFMDAGTAKGPLGMTGTTLDQTSMGMGGTLQLVSGIQTTCAGCSGNNSPSGQIARLTIQFAPEPGLLVPLAVGAAGVALLGRSRVRRSDARR